MKKTLLLLILLSNTVFAQKKVAITFNDLPFFGAETRKETQDATKNILKTLKKHKVKAVAFVSCAVLEKDIEDYKVTIIQEWLAKKHEIGNLTYSHLSFTETPLESYTEDIARGNSFLKQLLSQYGTPYRYFRPPYFEMGDHSDKKNGLMSFLAQEELILAPVTIDTQDWYFNLAYQKMGYATDTDAQNYIAKEYIKYTLESIKYSEELAQETVERPISHVITLRPNNLNLRCLDEILSKMSQMGYEFVTLEEAMKDPIYKTRDLLVSPEGINWLHRWRLSLRKSTSLEPPKIDSTVDQYYEN